MILQDKFGKNGGVMTEERKAVKNTVWIVACRVLQSVLNGIVTMFTARYFGPSDYGLLNYAASVAGFAAPVMLLGFDTTLVQEFVEKPEQKGTTLGTALGLNFVSGAVCVAGIAVFAALANPGEGATVTVCVLYSLNLPLQALKMTRYWFLAELKSKYTSLASLFAYVLVCLYRICLLAAGKGVCWFAVSQALDYLILSGVLLGAYHAAGGQKLRFSLKRGKQMLGRSRYYILSSLMVTMFAQTDKVMLKALLGDEAVGYYSAAVFCAGMTSFVFTAIIDSGRPVILAAARKDRAVFERRMTALYAIVVMLALAQSAVIAVSAEFVIRVLYGAQYLPSVGILRILVWYTTFSYLGAARTVWIQAEEKHPLLWKVNLYGALANAAFNFLLIPRWGANGAAAASLLTQMLTNFFLGLWMPQLRGNNALLLRSLDPRYLMEKAKAPADQKIWENRYE